MALGILDYPRKVATKKVLLKQFPDEYHERKFLVYTCGLCPYSNFKDGEWTCGETGSPLVIDRLKGIPKSSHIPSDCPLDDDMSQDSSVSMSVSL